MDFIYFASLAICWVSFAMNLEKVRAHESDCLWIVIVGGGFIPLMNIFLALGCVWWGLSRGFKGFNFTKV